MTPDRVQNCLDNGVCHECHLPISPQALSDSGIHHCQCGERFVMIEHALTYVDEIPVDEFIGG